MVTNLSSCLLTCKQREKIGDGDIFGKRCNVWNTSAVFYSWDTDKKITNAHRQQTDWVMSQHHLCCNWEWLSKIQCCFLIGFPSFSPNTELFRDLWSVINVFNHKVIIQSMIQQLPHHIWRSRTSQTWLLVVWSASHCSSLLFWLRCLHDPVSRHAGPVWLPSALHGVHYWAVHSFRSRACFRQNVSLVQRWVTLQAEGSAHVSLTNTWWVHLQFHILFFEFCRDNLFCCYCPRLGVKYNVFVHKTNVCILSRKPLIDSDKMRASPQPWFNEAKGWFPHGSGNKLSCHCSFGLLYCERVTKMWQGICFLWLKEFDSNFFLLLQSIVEQITSQKKVNY